MNSPHYTCSPKHRLFQLNKLAAAVSLIISVNSTYALEQGCYGSLVGDTAVQYGSTLNELINNLPPSPLASNEKKIYTKQTLSTSPDGLYQGYKIDGTVETCITTLNPPNPPITTCNTTKNFSGYAICMVGEINIPKNNGCNDNQVGDPIDTTTGNVFEIQTDYIGFGNVPLKWARYYNSMSLFYKPVIAGLGSHWQHNYSANIQLLASNLVGIVRPDGKIFAFISSGNNQWFSADKNILLKLTKTATGWQIINTNDETEIYDNNGKLTSITTHNRFTITLKYDTLGRLSTVTDHNGRKLLLIYNVKNNITQIINPLGKATTYTYDDQNNLSTVTYPDLTTRQYLYEYTAFPHAITGLIDENGKRLMTWTYDTQGRGTSSTAPNSIDKTTVNYTSYNTSTPISTITDALGKSRIYNYTTIAGSAYRTKSIENNNTSNSIKHDINGNITSYTDYSGIVTNYTYDLTRNLQTSRTEAAGTPQQRTITTKWHPTLRLPITIISNNLTKTFAYNSIGNIINISNKDTILGTIQTTTFEYNAQNLLVKTTDPRGYATTYTYDVQGDLLTKTNALGQTTQYTHDIAGHMNSITLPNGIKTQYIFDDRDNLSKTIKINQNLTEITSYTYTPAGQIKTVTLPNGKIITYTYDDAQRIILISDNLGNKINYTLDNLGNQKNIKTTDAAGILASEINHIYDDMSQRTQSISANHNNTYNYNTDGNVVSQKNATNNIIKIDYDSLKRPIITTNPDTGIITINYNPLDQITQIKGTVGDITQYTHDALDNTGVITSQDTGKTTHQYDKNGNIVSRIDALNNITTYTYDTINRLKTQTSKEGSSILAYDENAATQPGNIGQLTSINSPDVLQNYQYDAFGRLSLIKQTRAIQSNTTGFTGYTTQYRYTTGGKLAGITYPSGMTVDYKYTAGIVSSVLINGKAHLSQIKYNPLGALKSGVFSNGQLLSRGYDTSGHPLATNLALYTLDSTGKITGINTAVNTSPTPAMTNITQNITIGYDAMDRINKWQEKSKEIPAAPTVINNTQNNTWSWDTNDNRKAQNLALTSQINTGMISTTSSIQLLNYTPANRLKTNNYTRTVGAIITPTTTTIQTDAAGNILTDGDKKTTYNSLGRVKDFTLNGIITQYKYDLQNHRIAKIYPANNTHDTYVYAEAIDNLNSTQLLGEYNSSGTKQEYVWLGSTPIAVVQNGIILTIHADHLNTPRQLTDATKKVVWNWPYSAFGNNLPSTVGAVKFNLRYPGQYYDAESKLHYNINRYYEPITGRYTQSDLIGLNGGINTYNYVGGNAVGYSDEWGLDTTVTVWHPVGFGGSSFGHVSVSINDITYSFGTAGMSILSTTDYLKKNNFRLGMAVGLNLTYKQEESLELCLSKPQGEYNTIKNNCASPIQNCLSGLGINTHSSTFGIDTGNQIFPSSLGVSLINTGLVNRIIEYPASNSSNGWSAPWAR
jgi:RHS repeat-associated protein